MKFRNCILINFVTDEGTNGQAQSNMPLQLFQSWGHKTTLHHCFNDKINCTTGLRPLADFRDTYMYSDWHLADCKTQTQTDLKMISS